MILIQNRKKNASLVILNLEKLINFGTTTSDLAHCMSFKVQDNHRNSHAEYNWSKWRNTFENVRIGTDIIDQKGGNSFVTLTQPMKCSIFMRLSQRGLNLKL